MNCGNAELTKDEAIKEIFLQLKKNTLSIFCGAGATKDATKTDWINLFNETTQNFYKYNADIYMLASLEQRYHNTDFHSNIIERLREHSNKTSNNIESLINLDINQIWTTNYDNIIENAIKKRYKITPTVIKTSQDLLTQNLSDKYLVYKLNGSFQYKNSMILTKEDYYKYFKNQRLMFEMLKRQLIMDSFLFIGYSFKDELVLNALREIKEVLPNKGKIHYRFKVLKKKDEQIDDKYLQYMEYEIKYYYDVYNIKTIILDDYSDISNFLKKLYFYFCTNNVFISGSYRMISPEERRFIEDLIDELTKQLFEAGFSIYSGNGRGLGEVVVARTDKYLDKFPKGKFVNRPFIFLGDSQKKKNEANKKIIKDCKTMIIVSGQDDAGNSNNVIKQYKEFIAQNQDSNLIIPLPHTGYAAKEIYESSSFKSSDSYKTNIDNFQLLEKATTPKAIAKIVLNMISQKYKLI